MLKKSLLLMLLMVLLAPWAVAQQTITVYDQGGTTNNGYVPMYGGYFDDNTKSEFVIPAAKLTDMDGGTIMAMKFHISSVSSWGNGWVSTQTVFLKEVESDQLSAYSGTDGATVVYTGQFTVPASTATEFEITFTTPYAYNGGNLLVGIYNEAGGSGNYRTVNWKGETVNGASGAGSSGSSLAAVSFTQRNFIPQTTFTYVTTDPWISLSPSSTTVFTGSTQNLTASYGNVSGTPTITYSSSNAKIASVSGSGTSATVTGESVGTATITATMTYNATVYTATCEVTVEEPSYCTPSFSNTSDYINSFTTTGGEQNIDNTNTGQGTGGYSNFYDTHFVSAEPETEIGFSVVRGYDDSYNYAIWVDWNKDYEFDNTTEKVAQTSSTGDWTGTFTIPTTAAAGDYHMRVIQVYSSAATPCVSASYGEGEDYKLTVLAVNPYEKPVNLQVSSLTGTSATITWEAPNTDVVGYKYQYQPQGGDWTALTSTTALNAPLPGLTSNTAYTFQVQAIYAGDNESGFASKSFTTLIAIPYVYGFEDAAEFTKWETVDCEVNGYYNVTDNDYARTGNGCFMFSSYNGSTDPQYLISPELSGITNGLHVEFYYRSLQNNDPETFMVGYSTTDKNPDSFTWSAEVTSPDADYTRYSVNYPATVKYVAVKYTTEDKYYLFLDDFTFEESASCLEPTNVSPDNITTTSADITWTNGGEETAWDIYATDDINDVPNDLTTPTVEGITTKPYTLPLLPGTTYYVYVRAACSAKDHSAWSSPCSFHTDCEGMDLPYGPYGFEDGALTVCWNLLSTNVAYNTVSMNTTASYIHTGDYSLLMHSGSADGDFVLALPVIDDSYSLSDYRFVFWAMATNTTLKATIGIMEDPNDMTTFVAQSEEFNPASTFTEYKVPFNGYSGDGHYVALKVSRASSGSSYGNIYFDDIAIELLPSCIEPSGLTVSDETPHGATFSWTNGGSETEWHLYVSTENTAPADDINLKEVYVVDDNPHTIASGLNPETPYYVWVRTACGTDNYSTWVGPETFTTGIACPAPTGLAASEITGHTAKLSWNGTSESYILSVGTYDYTGTPVIGTILEEDFEDNAMQGWTTISNDNDSFAWSIQSGSSYAHESNYCVRARYTSSSVGGDANDWLISPQIAFGGNISFYAKRGTSNLDKIQVYVSTTGNNISDFTAITEEITLKTTYEYFEYDLSSYSGKGYVAIVYTAPNDLYYVYVDDITITGPVYPIAWNEYYTTSTIKDVDGLDPETPYFAKVKGNCGSEGYSQETAVISFTTDVACPAPTGLAYSNPKSDRVTLSWTTGGSEDWVVAYKKDTDSDFTTIDVNISDVTEEAGVITYILEGLDPETNYLVKVQDNCEPSYTGDGQSVWTSEITFETLAACAQPTDVTIDNITHNNADVAWTGDSDYYIVQYTTAATINAVFSEEFKTSSLPTGWNRYSTELTDNVLNGTTTLTTYNGGWSNTTYGLGQYNWKVNLWKSSVNVNYWMVTPSINVEDNYGLSFDMALTAYNDNGAPETAKMPDTNSRFVVLITDDDMATWTILREWNNSGSADVINSISNTGTPAIIDLSAYANSSVKIAFYCQQLVSGPDCDFHIDNVKVGSIVPAGTWQTLSPNPTTTAANLTGLTAGTKYDVQVAPSCEPTLFSDVISFTTVAANEKYFLTEGTWGTAANWMDNDMPNLSDNVQLQANATIASTDVAQADKITLNGKTLTINDGGQLKTNNTVTATVKKHITGYTGTDDHYYLIANPLNSMVSSGNFATVGLTSGDYDLYSWSYSATDGIEWRNFKASQFSLQTKTGYLYANASDVDLTFTGTVAANNAEVSIGLNYATSSTYYFNGWNLVGNPFVCDAFITDTTNTDTSSKNLAFYRMNADGDGFTAVVKGTIKPMEGIFVKANAQSQNFKFTREEPVESPGSGNLNINLAQTVTSRGARGSRDNAIVRFDGGNSLDKFSFRDNTAKVYIPQDGKDYAVVSAEAQGELPVNFKAAENGNYTLSFTTEDVEFSYLHLIDNMTGNDVDLLQTPTYNFDAQYTDIAARFKLVFAKSNGNMGDDFGFIDANGNLIINGEGTLRIIDALGRIIMTRETTFGVTTENMVPGVYVLQLINGNDVKTQKIVVK